MNKKQTDQAFRMALATVSARDKNPIDEIVVPFLKLAAQQGLARWNDNRVAGYANACRENGSLSNREWESMTDEQKKLQRSFIDAARSELAGAEIITF
jgi:hypothetical protein